MKKHPQSTERHTFGHDIRPSCSITIQAGAKVLPKVHPGVSCFNIPTYPYIIGYQQKLVNQQDKQVAAIQDPPHPSCSQTTQIGAKVLAQVHPFLSSLYWAIYIITI